MTYTLEMSDGVSTETVDFDEEPTAEECETECEEWCRGGDWGQDGASIPISWTLTDEDGEEANCGHLSVEIEPDHDALIRAAGGDTDCDHDWTSEGEGGCDSNPGVWSHGGTTMTFATHCRTCGLHRVERSTGSQRNPGEHDTVRYEQPKSWCAEYEAVECKAVECSCEPAQVTCCVCGEDVDADDAETVATDHGPDSVCSDCEYEGD